MLFNSLNFVIFFAIFYAIYWIVLNKHLKLQNIFILVSCYFFYAWADWRFLFLLIGISALNYYLGILIHQETNEKRKKIFYYIAIVQGVGGLLYFKYFIFFITSINDALQAVGFNSSLHTIKIIVPIGISYFTFRILSYIIDIYNRKTEPTKDIVVFFNYVAFFPSILSGPIDKAKNLIPQFEKKREFSYEQTIDSFRQILWGLFKKVVIADNCAMYTDQIFGGYEAMSGSSLLLGAFLYTMQLYADFSGYTDMAIGIARLVGFRIAKNFDFPFFAQNIAEFWRKWHMSLTIWLTEYVFTPLSIALRDYGKIGLSIAIILNFTICGIWHGANWTYVLFGFLHGLYFIPLIVKGTMNKKKKIAKGKNLPSFKEFTNVLGTFSLVMFTEILFRAESVEHGLGFFFNIFSLSLFSIPEVIPVNVLFFIVVMMTVEWFQRTKDHGLQIEGIKQPWIRWSIYYGLVILVFLFQADQATFIYLQF